MSLCSGYGGIDLGLRLAIPSARTICYVEREATVAAILAARFEDAGQAGDVGTLDPAPIWSDLRTFDGKPWRGLVDLLCAGYPCQPFSCAGLQLGVADPRHLWPHVARIIAEAEPEWVFLENVGNHLKIGFREVASELRRMGYSVEARLFSAEEVGAPHLRQRLFALAHREGGRLGVVRESSRLNGQPDGSGAELEDTGDHYRRRGIGTGKGATRERRRGSAAPGAELEDASRFERPRQIGKGSGRGRRVCQAGHELADARNGFVPVTRRRSQGRDGTGPAGAALGNANNRDGGRTRTEQSDARQPIAGPGAQLADAGNGRSPQRRNGRREKEERASTMRGGLPVFCPGPDDLDAWRKLLARHPEVEPAICTDAYGSAPRVDQLRALGNGVVPLVVGHAYRTLRAAFECGRRVSRIAAKDPLIT